MDQKSITGKELEYEYLRSLCDLAISYHRLAEFMGLQVPGIERTISFLENESTFVLADIGLQ